MSSIHIPAFDKRKARPKKKAQGRCDCGVYRFPHRPGSCAKKAEQSVNDWAVSEARHAPEYEDRERAAVFAENLPGADTSFDFFGDSGQPGEQAAPNGGPDSGPEVAIPGPSVEPPPIAAPPAVEKQPWYRRIPWREVAIGAAAVAAGVAVLASGRRVSVDAKINGHSVRVTM